MILRRITKHVREQNWTAIAIDFVIVVVGVFMGIQLGNWNEQRGASAREAAFRERLIEDLTANRERLAPFMARRERRMVIIERVEEMYFGDAELRPLNENECTHLADGYILTLPPIEIPSITEAFTSGQIDLISDRELARALIAVKQSEDRTRNSVAGISEAVPRLANKFPEAITRTRAVEPLENPADAPLTPYRLAAKCHFFDQPPDPQFISAIAVTTKMNTGYIAMLRRHIAELDALEAVLRDKTVQELPTQ